MYGVRRCIIGNLKVAKSNRLIDCFSDCYISKFELQFMAEVISKISMFDLELSEIRIELDDFYEECYGNVLSGKTKRDIIKRLEELKEKDIFIFDNIDNNNHKFKWLKTFNYDYSEKVATVEIDIGIINDVFNLESKFTKIDRDNYIKMETSYGIRLMELMSKVFNNVDTRNFEIDKLRKLLHVGDKHKRNYHFKTRVIEEAIKDVNSVCDFNLEYSIEKRGRRIKYIKFIKGE